MPSNNVQSKESDMPSFQSPLAEVEMNVPSTNQDSELDGGKNCQLTNGAAVEAQENTQPQTSSPEIHQDDDDDDDIQEVGQVINTTSNGFLSGTEKTAELEKKEDAGGGGESDPGVIDIVINNVVCSYSVGCHINLREVATNGNNVEYRREHGMVTMKLRKPPTTASIWSSGKITCTGSTSEVEARTAARRVARALQKLGCKTRFKNFRVVNVLGTCTMPFAIKITPFSRQHRNSASYEPELHPGVTYRIPHPKATLKIFSTGSITVTAPSIANVQAAIEHVYPLVSEFSKERTAEEEARRSATSVANHAVRHRPVGFSLDEDEEEEPGVGPPSFIDEFPDSPPSFMKRKRSDLSFGNDNKLRKLGPIDLVSDDSDDSSDDMEDVDDGFS
ncbi:hypothetical protein HAZT_HAZT000702 [Hyalella azteca]|nr:hypothetical protein HAZT_HAZT000702 [Hyalella azteca]